MDPQNRKNMEQLCALSSDQEDNRRQRVIRLTQFQYPPDEFKLRCFQSVQEFLRFFQETPVVQWKYTQKMYTVRTFVNKEKDSRKYVLECRQCHIKIIVKTIQGKNKITFERYDNHHRHVMNHRTKVLQQEMIFQFFANLDPSQKYHDYYKVALDKFQINEQRLRYVMNKFLGRHTETLQDAMQRVKSQVKCEFRVWRNQIKRQQMVLMVTQTMKQNYRRYGDCLCFDFTYRLIRKQRFFNELGQMQQQQWSTGFFLGQDSNKRMTLFGVCLVKGQTAQHIKDLFRAFFGIMDNKSPSSIITDDQGALGKALRQLKKQNSDFKYVHLLDQFHKLQALKRLMVKNNISRQKRVEYLRLFSAVMKQPNPVIFKQRVEEMMQYVEDKTIVENFLYEKNLHCASQIGKIFFGLSVASVRVQGFNNIIKTYVPYSTHIPRFFKQILRVERHLNNRTGKVVRSKLQQVDQSIHDKLQGVNMILQSKIYDVLIGHVSRLRYLDYEQPVQYSTKQVCKSNNRKVYVIQRGYRYEVTYFSSIDFWCCQCNLIYHNGLPCVHLMMVLTKFKVTLQRYINPRWIRKQDYLQIGKKQNVNTLHIPYRMKKTVEELKEELKPSGYLLVSEGFASRFDKMKIARNLNQLKEDNEKMYVRYNGQNVKFNRMNAFYRPDLNQANKRKQIRSK